MQQFCPGNPGVRDSLVAGNGGERGLHSLSGNMALPPHRVELGQKREPKRRVIFRAKEENDVTPDYGFYAGSLILRTDEIWGKRLSRLVSRSSLPVFLCLSFLSASLRKSRIKFAFTPTVNSLRPSPQCLMRPKIVSNASTSAHRPFCPSSALKPRTIVDCT